MATIERNRVFEQAGIEEFRQGGVTILSEAERISAELASLAGQVSSICARVPAEAKEAGLDTLASQARTEIEAADYQTTKGRIEQFAGKINSDVYAADVLAGEAQREAKEAASKVIAMLGELEELLSDGSINLPYEAFKERLDACAKEMEEELPDIQEKLRQAEDTMCGLQQYTALYSRDPVHLATGNLYYEKEILCIEGEYPLTFKIFYNTINRRRGPLLRNWGHSYRMTLTQKPEAVVLDWEDGARYYFNRHENGSLHCDGHPGMKLVRTEEGFRLSKREGKEHKVYFFDQQGAVTGIQQERHLIHIEWNENAQVKAIREQNGAEIRLNYDEEGRLETLSDHSGRVCRFCYEGNRLTTVSNPMGEKEAYTYAENGKIETITDERGIVKVKNTYDRHQRVIRQEYPDGGVQNYQYLDKEGRVSFTETDGSVKEYIHDGRLRIRKVRGMRGTETYTYTGSGQLKSHTDAAGGHREYTYREDGQPVCMSDKDGSSEQILYKEGGRKEGIRQKDGGIHSYSYDKQGRLTGYTTPMGLTTQAEYDEKGNLIKICYPDGTCQKITYDDKDRIAALVMPDGNEYTYEYDSLNRLVRAEDKNGTAILSYDAMNRLTEARLPDGRRRQFSYDAGGFLREEKDELGNGSTRIPDAMGDIKEWKDSSGRKIIFERDTLQRITAILLPDSSRLEYSYRKGEKHPCTTPDGSRLFYDALDRLTEIESPMGRKIKLSYDPCGRLTAVERHKNDRLQIKYDICGRVQELDVNGRKTTYGYDGDGRCIRRTDESKETLWEYDASGRLLCEKETDAEGITRRRYPKKEKAAPDIQTAYGMDGRIESITDAAGTKVHYRYDVMGFLWQVIRDDKVWQTIERNSRGQLVAVTDACGNRSTYTYDREGKLTSCTDMEGYERHHHYDELARPSQTEYSDGTSIRYKYGESGELTEAECAGESICIQEEIKKSPYPSPIYSRDEDGRIIKIRYPGEISQELEYRENGMVGRLTVTDRDGMLHRRSYTYDERGNCTQVLTEGRIRPEENGQQTYEYDSLNRLLRITQNGKEKARYAYDGYGNRISGIEEGCETTYIYDEADRLIQRRSGIDVWTYHYDRRGSLLQTERNGEKEASYTYDARGNLIRKEEALRTTSYRYDALNRRKEKVITENGNSRVIRYSHDPKKRIHTLCSVECDGRRMGIAYHAEGHLEQIWEEGKPRYYITDPNGTPILSTNEEGKLTETYVYDAFGRAKESYMDPIGYGGYENEGDGTYLAGCRYYDAVLGRFISRDRLGGTICDIQSMNPYVYVRNNPLTYTDPDGLEPVQTSYAIQYASAAVVGAAYTTEVQNNAGTTGSVESCSSGAGDYLMRSLEQVILGNFTDEVTLLGTSGQVLLGILGFDVVGDIRDIIADIVNWEWSWSYFGLFLLDVASLFPVVGVVKYLDEAGILVKAGLKHLDEGLTWVKNSVKSLGDLEIVKGIRNFFTKGGDELAEETLKATIEEASESALKQVDDVVSEGIEGGTSAKGLIGHDFEDYLSKTIGGEGSFSVGGRDFDGGIGNRWWEAKSGNYWSMLEENPNKLAKFKSDMGDRLRIATENGATYEIFSNTPIPESIKQWLTKKGITFTELLD